MASLKQITVGTTSYDIIPDAITDSSANYKASCPTISSNTTVEVASNKTTIINSSSTATQYPSAKAVYTAIQNASKAGTFASNIGTNAGSAFVPLISTGGMFSTTYLQNLGIPENKKIDIISGGVGSTIGFMSTAGTVTKLSLSNSSTAGTIASLGMSTSTKIGDSTIPTADSTTIGQNGLYGSGTIYIAATGATSQASALSSTYAFAGTIINKAGYSTSCYGGYINKIENNSYAIISTIANNAGGTIAKIENFGDINEIIINYTGKFGGGAGSSYTGSNGINFKGGSARGLVPADSTCTFDLMVPGTGAMPKWSVINKGKIQPWQEVSNISVLQDYLNLQTGILYKYTGSTTTYNGVTYTNGNFYRYEA